MVQIFLSGKMFKMLADFGYLNDSIKAGVDGPIYFVCVPWGYITKY